MAMGRPASAGPPRRGRDGLRDEVEGVLLRHEDLRVRAGKRRPRAIYLSRTVTPDDIVKEITERAGRVSPIHPFRMFCGR